MTTTLSSPKSIEANIQAREISGQIAIGENIIQIGSVHGGIVNINQQPVKARLTKVPGPVTPSLRPFPGFRDRVAEVKTATAVLQAGEPIEFNGQAGFGKTSILRRLAFANLSYPDGVVYLRVLDHPVADLLQMLCDAFFISELERKLRLNEMKRVLKDIQALVLLDDVALNRNDVGALMDAAPNCNFVLTARDRLLWREGKTIPLNGLPLADAMELIEWEIGHALKARERAVAKMLCDELKGNPLLIKQAAAMAQEDGLTLNEVTRRVRAHSSAAPMMTSLLDTLAPPERRLLALLAAMQGAPLHLTHLAALTKPYDVDEMLLNLKRRGLIEERNNSYHLVGSTADVLDREGETASWHEPLLAYFTAWADKQRHNPGRVQVDMDAMLHVTRLAVNDGRWPDVLKLVWALDAALALSKRWQRWRQVLEWGVRAAKAGRSQEEEAWNWHQLGTLSLLLGDKTFAQQALSQALSLRQALGDVNGTAVTQHNINVLIGSAVPPPQPPDEPPPELNYPVPPESGGSFLANLVIVCLSVLALALLGFMVRETYLKPAPSIIPPTPIVLPTATKTPTPEPTSTPSPTNTATFTPTPTATQTPTSTPTNTPRPPTAVPTDTPTHTPTPTRTPTPTWTPTPTDTPTPIPNLRAFLTLNVNQGTRTLSWSTSGGLSPYNGTLTAEYVDQNRPYETVLIRMPSGRYVDDPPTRCEGAFTILYTLTMYDSSGQLTVDTVTSEILFVC